MMASQTIVPEGPAVDGVAEVDAGTVQTPVEPPKPYKVLLVDDDALYRSLMTRYLEGGGFQFRHAESGARGIEAAVAWLPDVILLDVHMEDMDGFTACETLKANDATRDIPVIFVTGDQEVEPKVKAFEAGGTDYITKSSARAEILARIRTQIRLARLQRELRANRDELAEQVRQIEEHTQKELELQKRLRSKESQLMQADKLASIGQLAAGVAHEINNPIGYVSSNLNSLGHYVDGLKQMLAAYEELAHGLNAGEADLAPILSKADALRESLDIDYVISDIGHLITESMEGAQRVRQIVADLRDFSHVDNPDVTEEDLNQLIDRTINVAWNELKYKTQVVREYGDIPAVPCYGGKIGQVVLNMLVNAAHAIVEQGTITIRTGQAQDIVWVELIDTGCGIPPENLARIFEPFFTTKEVGKGTGLGLHLAYQIIQAHGGRIDARSTVGEGSTFRIELPLSGPPATARKEDESDACGNG